MKPIMVVTAPVGTRSGYGAHSRDICRSLIDLDKFDIRIWPVRWGSTPQNALSEQNPQDLPIIKRLLQTPEIERQPDIHVHIVVPNEFQNIAKYNIGITAGIETTACPPNWIEGLNKMDLNIVPAQFVKNTIENTKFDKHDENTKQKIGELMNQKPVEVLFEGVDTEVYKKTNEFSKDLVDEFKLVKEDFCFLHVGHWLQGNIGEDRKDISMLVKTFYETFKNQKNQPALILKTSGATPCIIDREEILDKIDSIKSQIVGELPNIYVLHGDLRDEEMNQLYNHPKVKAHVSFTHGEGFGRPLLEATLSEKPVIASNWSGQTDFLNTDSVLLPGSMIDVPKNSFPKEFVVKGAKWFQVNYSYASSVLKEVHKNYSKYVMKAKKQAIVNKSKFTLDQMTKTLDDILNKHLPKFEPQPQKVDLKLPTLKKVSKPKKVELPKLKRVN
tara:strand:- start:531 stop:1859 length:1329 start_codon:yes stop_codon:yes gene_type:complete